MLDNLALRTAMAVSNPEFPAVAKNNVAEPERLNDLESWVDAAAMALH